MQNITIEQAVRNIADIVGAGCHISDEIGIDGPGRPKSEAPQRRVSSRKVGSEGYVGKISIPMDGGKYYIEFMLRESDLTEQLKKLRKEKMKEVLGENHQNQSKV
ncbi:unnamed protein product [marine sediment metagenome]|uniref:Uncharacterized protein n=1 Tax=marine sediment metagenome TaxID=412755 RepID=X1V9C2_9ZZZZ